MYNVSDLQKRIEARLQADLDAQNIRCPKCGYIWDMEALSAHITYHGEDGPRDDECPNCEAELTITEDVVRTFEVSVRTAGGNRDE